MKTILCSKTKEVIINSVNGEEKSMNAILPVAGEYGAAVIGLTMNDNGIIADLVLGRDDFAMSFIECSQSISNS